MNVLITGADGMLGTSLVQQLSGDGHKLFGLIHPSSTSNSLDNLEITKIRGDVLSPASLDKAFENIEVVIHAAASTSLWPARNEMVRRINIEGTRNVIEKVLEYKIAKLIYIGSASSVNTSDTGKSKYEFPGAKFRMDYIDSKYEAFKMVQKSIEKDKLPATIVLPTYMLGPFDSQLGSNRIILNFLNGIIKMYPRGGRNFIHVKDVAKIIHKCLEKDNVGKHYIAGNENLSFKSFFKIVSKVVEKKELKMQSPGWLVLFAGLLGNLYGFVFKKQPVLTYQMARVSRENQFVQCSKTLQEFDVVPTPIENAVEDFYNWYVEFMQENEK